ncbi:sigma 54-interacting transcriptional regulator [Robertkochia solimangrovi]|uniref:sigma 54-interacting transcriptional regulator n=1 Tax=Robertkochia solimangrovi TaxID=2213046 RepID=UPI00117FBE51|nr:sigma 54-interacting transcriptional regulator [Robertkochia solimangrovi]TRZ43796.1 DNA-binding response regulator [Robertkochia solimangrovi]
MKKKLLIVEDEFIVANDLSLILKKAGYIVTGIAGSVRSARDLIEDSRPDMVLLDISLHGKLNGIDLARELNEKFIPFIYISANSNRTILEEAKSTRPNGFIVKPFREKDVLVTLEIAFYHHQHSLEYWAGQYRSLEDRLQKLVASSDRDQMSVVRAFQSVIPFDFCYIDTFSKGDSTGYLRIGFNEYQKLGISEIRNITKVSFTNEADRILPKAPQILDDHKILAIGNDGSVHSVMIDHFRLRSVMILPLLTDQSPVGCVYFYSRLNEAFSAEFLNILIDLQEIINKILLEDTRPITKHYSFDTQITMNESRVISEDEVVFDKMVGKSPSLLRVFDLIRNVAPMNTSVLILGESGTGKELVASSIHANSSRGNKPFITVNCATFPENLVESILFGHEKGSFTGATNRSIGKFEQADQGTIFLDEIGEMPLEMQVKLLRVLQEREFERIGNNTPIKTDVRVIAATNKNLEEEVAAGRFRLDLYYRLYVYPIDLPPLRERKEDIELLVYHFIDKFKASLQRSVRVSDHAMKKFKAYSWPGNIRELEHTIERSILLSRNGIIEDVKFPEIGITGSDSGFSPDSFKALKEVEREYILSVLKNCHGKIFGAGGAAEILKIPTSTLNSKIKKLGIRKEEIYSGREEG